MTRKLFWEDPYLTRCKAKVIKLNGLVMTVDRTVFFGFSGGQASDSGSINGFKVKEALAGEDIIYLLEENPLFREGEEVTIKIDGNRRHKLMRLHSAAHVIYFLFAEKTGIKELIGSNIEEGKARLDYKYDEPLTSLLPKIGEEANQMFSKDVAIKTYADNDNPNKRWWECGNWKCPCGGTHVKSTKEIGKIFLKRKNIGAGKERIEITVSQ